MCPFRRQASTSQQAGLGRQLEENNLRPEASEITHEIAGKVGQPRIGEREHERTNLSDFIRRKAVEAAEMDLIERRIVTIPAADWEKFEAWVDQPAKDVPALRDLAAHRPEWQD